MACRRETSASQPFMRSFISWPRAIRNIWSWPNASSAFPFKRARQRAIDYLEYDEIDVILKTINRSTPQGSRDYALLATMFNTGGRVQEIAELRACDLQLTKPFQVRLFGKGRKERYCPLWPQTAAVLRAFCDQRNLDLRSETRVFLESPRAAADPFRHPLHPRKMPWLGVRQCSEPAQETVASP